MERSALFICKYGDFKGAVRVEDNMGYDEVLGKIGDKFIIIPWPLSVHLFYSIPGYTNCSLQQTSDLVKIFELLRGASSRLVDIDVRDQSVQLVDNSSPGNHSEAFDVPTMDASDDDVDLLPSFMLNQKKFCYLQIGGMPSKRKDRGLMGGLRSSGMLWLNIRPNAGFLFNM